MFQPITLPIRRPFLTTAACAAILGIDIRKVELAAEDGSLQFAFNLAVNGTHKRCLRIYAGSVKRLADAEPRRFEAAHELRSLLNQIFPCIEDALSLVNLARVLCCDRKIPEQFIANGELRCKRAARGRGRYGSALVYRASAIEMLERRRVT
jgi:hypothetical protein